MLAHPVSVARVLYAMACSCVASWLVSIAFLSLLGGLSFGLVVIRHHAHAAYQGAIAIANPSAAMRVFPRTTLTQFAADNALNLLLPGATWTKATADTQRIIVFTVWVLGVAVVMPVAFLLLGQTMNRHKVQRRHLWRVAAYSFVPLPVLATCFSLVTWTLQTIEGVRIWLTNAAGAASLNVEGYAWADRETGWRVVRLLDDRLMFNLQQWITREGTALVALLVLGFIWLFWFRASSRYFRLPRSAPDTLALLFVSLLLTPAVAYVAMLGIRILAG
jgi:hypothetical protein